MRKAVIVSAVRTALARAINGSLRNTRPEYTGSEVVKEAIRRSNGLKPEDIDDVVVGCAFPEAEMGMNLGRIIALKSGLPTHVPGMTINRYCSSGLDAIAVACQRVMCGFADVVVAAGVEHMSLVPMGGNKPLPDPELMRTMPEAYITMGLTAENVAQRFSISREKQDQFALESHRKAIRAIQDGRFEEQILPLHVADRTFEKGVAVCREKIFARDECVRFDTSLEALSRLRPIFRAGGTVTAGNSCPINDGAAAVVVMSEERAHQLGLRPMASFRSYGVAGVDPDIMGIGPAEAVPKALRSAGMSLDQIDLIELNEAFASQSVYVVETLGIDMSKLNVNGGSIALGHPLGCTGVYLTVKLLYEMQRREASFGLVTMCIGGGMGAAAVFERQSQ
ncbi:MAG: acetyl-CoA C-acyltransferase [Chloroflexi bacterium]|nr:MAG: acetyl-CoA C-acyltransferase [Chloroflexota bacterium]RLC93999.1 MAG: acetyl-CoA C-acyltransferase [Chloroflexota bacterium]